MLRACASSVLLSVSRISFDSVGGISHRPSPRIESWAARERSETWVPGAAMRAPPSTVRSSCCLSAKVQLTLSCLASPIHELERRQSPTAETWQSCATPLTKT